MSPGVSFGKSEISDFTLIDNYLWFVGFHDYGCFKIFKFGCLRMLKGYSGLWKDSGGILFLIIIKAGEIPQEVKDD